MEDGVKKKTAHGSALEKALAVIEIVSDQPQAIGLPDLMARLHLPRQTLHRTLRTLEDKGLLLRDPSRDRFSIGPQLSHLALSIIHSKNQSAPIRVVLRELVDSIQETCNIGVLDGGEFAYLERIECNWSLRVFLQAGSRVPAYCTSGGKALLAHLPPDICKRLLFSAPLRRYTDMTITDPAALKGDLARVRDMGFSTNDQEFTVGVVGVGVPILDSSGRPIAALACHAPVARTSLERLQEHAPILKAAAGRLARAWEGFD
jgi:DNA-binding IclR family transcriptional regulator